MPMDNKSSILNTDAALNSMDRHNVEWISGAARIPFCDMDVLQVHAYSYDHKCHRCTWSFGSLVRSLSPPFEHL
jgi:hypothetical protein